MRPLHENIEVFSASMQPSATNRQIGDLSEQVLEAASGLVDSCDKDDSNRPNLDSEGKAPFLFHGDYSGRMEMAAERQTVTQYLDQHREWFLRCAHPMTAEPLGENGYALTVGHFGALGYDVEPKVGLNLLPQANDIYRIETIPVPGYEPPGYEVDFQAALSLNEDAPDAEGQLLTQVNWDLNLQVWVYLPRFVSALPKQIIQKTGDHLLNRVVRQMSRCLTLKVQEDFHQSLNLTLPESCRKRNHHFFERFSKAQDA